jgi:hypothetical protein
MKSLIRTGLIHGLPEFDNQPRPDDPETAIRRYFDRSSESYDIPQVVIWALRFYSDLPPHAERSVFWPLFTEFVGIAANACPSSCESSDNTNNLIAGPVPDCYFECAYISISIFRPR